MKSKKIQNKNLKKENRVITLTRRFAIIVLLTMLLQILLPTLSVKSYGANGTTLSIRATGGEKSGVYNVVFNNPASTANGVYKGMLIGTCKYDVALGKLMGTIVFYPVSGPNMNGTLSTFNVKIYYTFRGTDKTASFNVRAKFNYSNFVRRNNQWGINRKFIRNKWNRKFIRNKWNRKFIRKFIKNKWNRKFIRNKWNRKFIKNENYTNTNSNLYRTRILL